MLTYFKKGDLSILNGKVTDFTLINNMVILTGIYS